MRRRSYGHAPMRTSAMNPCQSLIQIDVAEVSNGFSHQIQ